MATATTLTVSTPQILSVGHSERTTPKKTVFEVDEKELKKHFHLEKSFFANVWKDVLKFQFENAVSDRDILPILNEVCPFSKYDPDYLNPNTNREGIILPRKLVGNSHTVAFIPKEVTLRILKKLIEDFKGKPIVVISDEILEKWGDIPLVKNKYIVVPREEPLHENKYDTKYAVIDTVSALAFYVLHKALVTKPFETYGAMFSKMSLPSGESLEIIVNSWKGKIYVRKNEKAIYRLGLDRIKAS